MPEPSEKDDARQVEVDTDQKCWEDRLERVMRAKNVPVPPPRGPLREKPGPAKNVGDETPNPLPDDPSECGGAGGGDAGRTS